MKYKALSCQAGVSTVYAGTRYEYLRNMWVYSGKGCQGVHDYHWMFVEPNTSTLEYVSED